MLKKIPRLLSAEALNALMLMGHGDEFLICDVNHPAATVARDTVYGQIIDLAGADIPTALAAILELFPVDTFVEQTVKRMQVVGNPAKCCRSSTPCRRWSMRRRAIRGHGGAGALRLL